MDQQEIHVVQPHPFQRPLQPCRSPIVALELAVQFGGDEHFAAVHPAGPDTVAHTFLVAVFHGRIDVPVPGFHGTDDGGSHLIVVQRPGAEPQLRDAVTVIERDER